jgi:hypothetical protein
VDELRRVLDVPHSPTLLGGTQALLEGGRLVFERPGPDAPLVRGLWALLPYHARAEMWPASFSFGNAHRFHVLVVPRAVGPDFADCITEENAGDYPEGSYELGVQTAVESGNQHDLDRLLTRRSRSQTLRLAVAILAASILIALGSALLPPTRPAPAPPTTAAVRPAAAPDLPPPEACPQLSLREREELTRKLGEVGRGLGVAVPPGAAPTDLAGALMVLDHRLGTPDPARDPRSLGELGPLQRQLRALLWKHHVADYNKPGLNTVELADRLRQRLQQEGLLPEGSRD